MARISRRGFLGGALGAGALAASYPLSGLAGPRPPFPELSASGTPGAMGYRHGRAFAAQIRRNLGFYYRWLRELTGASPRRLRRLALGFKPVLGQHQPALLEEIQGIARGSRRGLAEILMLNARTDMLVMGRRGGAGRGKADDGCTALALRGTRGGSPALALGQNWDWRQEMARGIVVLRLRPRGGPRIVTFTEAGMVGKVGFNSSHLGVTLNFLAHPDADPDGPYGVPVHCLLRAVMGCGTVAEATALVRGAPRCAAANFIVARHQPGKTPEAVDLEWTHTRVARLGLSDPGGYVVHTNHFKDRGLSRSCKGCTPGRSTTNRDQVATRLARELATRIADPVARMQRILASTAGRPYGISREHAVKATGPSITLAGIVMDLTGGKLHVVRGAPSKGTWVARPGPAG